jgi:hypothetical protein
VKAVYSQLVEIETVNFSDEEKQAVRENQSPFAYGSTIKNSGDGFFVVTSLNGEVKEVYEGDAIITFVDGYKKVLTEDQIEASISIVPDPEEFVSEEADLS